MTDVYETDPAIQQEVERNYRRNFLVNSLDGASFWFGISFLSTTIILPLYVSHFTSNPLLIGLIPFINTGGFLLPQLFVANLVERAPRKKWFPVNLGFFLERVPVLLLAPSAYFLATSHPGWALAAFFILYTWFSAGGGLIIVGWQDMIAKIIPVDRRGRFFGITNFVGNASGVAGALAVTAVLDKFTFPIGYVMAFAAAGVLVLLSWIFLSMAVEPPVVSSKPVVSQWEYLRTLPKVVRGDHNFLKYLLSQIFYQLSWMASGFLVVYAAQTWHLPDAQAGAFVIVMQAGQALGNLFFGFLADKRGHKLSLEICFLLNVLSFGLAFFAPAPAWFYPIFFLRGVVYAASFVSASSIVYEFVGPENRPTYIGLANTIPGVAGTVAPLIGGWLAGATGYPWLFVLSALFAAASWAMLRFTVREPRHVGAASSVAG